MYFFSLLFIAIKVMSILLTLERDDYPCKFLSQLQISRLIYTNSGVAILALASNAIHLLWKWPRNERNSTGKVKT